MLPETGTPQDFKHAMLALGVKCYICEQWCLPAERVHTGYTEPDILPRIAFLCAACLKMVQLGYSYGGIQALRVAIRFTKCGHVAILQYETVANWGTKEPLADLLTIGRLEGYCGDCTRLRSYGSSW
jgi:hypothetical protein